MDNMSTSGVCEKCYDTGYIACGKVHGTNELIVKPCPHCKTAKQL